MYAMYPSRQQFPFPQSQGMNGERGRGDMLLLFKNKSESTGTTTRQARSASPPVSYCSADLSQLRRRPRGKAVPAQQSQVSALLLRIPI